MVNGTRAGVNLQVGTKWGRGKIVKNGIEYRERCLTKINGIARENKALSTRGFKKCIDNKRIGKQRGKRLQVYPHSKLKLLLFLFLYCQSTHKKKKKKEGEEL